MGFRKISSKEYEIQIDGRTKTIFVPFGKTELLFREFIINGGMIDPVTGEVQNDLQTLMASFKGVGNILLTEYDETGKLIKEGNCFNLDSEELISLFQLATEVVASFTQGLTKMKDKPLTPNPEEGSEEKAKRTRKDSQ